MNQEEALDKIAFHNLKKITRDEAVEIIHTFFREPEIKPDELKEQLNITVIAQWHTHTPPPDLKPGNPIYRPILIDRLKRRFRGYTNAYLAHYLKKVVGVEVDTVEGPLPDWLACPVCDYRTFPALGSWLTCPVCAWNSDPMQEAMPDEPIGQNGISLNEARKNFVMLGAITEAKKTEVDPQGKYKYAKGT